MKHAVFNFCLAAMFTATARGESPVELSRPDSLSINATVGELADTSVSATAEGKLATARQIKFISDFGEWQLDGFRTTVEVGGRHPYLLVMEDYPELGKPVLLERGFPAPAETELAGFDYDNGNNDILLKRNEGPTAALRILRTSAAEEKLPPGMRIGGPAMVVDGHRPQRTLTLPAYTAQPSFRLLLVDDTRDAPVCKWLEGGKVLRVEWFDQIDVFTFNTEATGQTQFVLERRRGEFRDEVLSFGLPYVPPKRETGSLLAHWSFDGVTGRTVPDVSGHGLDATLTGGLRLTPGVRGYGVDGVSCAGVRAGELVIPTREGELPGKLEYGALQLPGAAFQTITNRMTLSFWYAMPPTIQGAYHPYMSYWKAAEPRRQFEAGGFKLYSYDHWMNGHCITAAGLGHHRLFGMIGPPQPRDKWNHYTVVVDGLTARLYINGDLKLQQTGKKPLDGIIGAAESGTMLKNTWARMDEIRLYDYPLSMDEIQQQFRQDGLGRLCRLTFDALPVGKIREGTFTDDAGNECRAENVEIVKVGQALLPVLPGGGTDKSVHPTGEAKSEVGQALLPVQSGGNVLRFGPEGGKVVLAPTITQGKHIQAVTFAAWVKLPEGYQGRSHLLHSGNHGHRGMYIGFWRNNLWGTASQNAFEGSVTPGEWTHVVCSYGQNRIRSYINGVKVQDNQEAYPNPKGFGIAQLSLAYDAPIEIDDIQVFSFNLSDGQVEQLYDGREVKHPPPGQEDPGGEKRVIIPDRSHG